MGYQKSQGCCYGCEFFRYTENLQGHCTKANDFVLHDHICKEYIGWGLP